MEEFGSSNSLLRGVIFNESISAGRKEKKKKISINLSLEKGAKQGNIPLRLLLIVQRHIDGIFCSVADRVQFLQQELDELSLVALVNDGKTINNDEGVQSFLHSNFILLLEIYCAYNNQRPDEENLKRKEVCTKQNIPEKSISISSSSWRSCS